MAIDNAQREISGSGYAGERVNEGDGIKDINKYCIPMHKPYIVAGNDEVYKDRSQE